MPEGSRYRVLVEVGLQEIALRRGNYEKARDSLAALPPAAKSMRVVVLLEARAQGLLGQYEQAIQLLQQLV